MARTCRSLKEWTVALEESAWALVEGRVAAGDREKYRVRAEPCEQHGPACACVVYGMLLEHLAWAREDPRRLARRLVGTMFPPGTLPPE